MKSSERIQQILSCLGEPSRFRMLRALKGGDLCVGDIAQRVGLSQSCATRHLQALQRAGLVVGLRSGKRVVFRIRAEESVVSALVDWACPDEPAEDEVHVTGHRPSPSSESKGLRLMNRPKLEDFLL